MNFGVIYYVLNDNVIIIMEGKEKELLDIIDIIKNNVNKDAKVKLLEEDDYNDAKRDMQELNRLVLGE